MTFFHGTNADLNIGDILLPGDQLSTNMNHGRSAHVYMTADQAAGVSEGTAISEAYAWARTACMVAEDEDAEEDQCAYVYIVEPCGSVEVDGSDDVGEEAFRTTSAVITGFVDPYDLYEMKPGFGNHYLMV
jgi:hypothetical protein